MLDTLLSSLAPHLCSSCGRTGAILCEDCKYDIIAEPFNECLVCSMACGVNGVCLAHKTYYTRAWCVGERRDVLLKIIDDYKFENTKEAHKVLAVLLSERTGMLPSSITVTSVPTLPSHIRQRGYDHAMLLARQLAKLQKVTYASLLKRTSNAEQRGASKKQRHAQAQKAFVAKGAIHKGVYLLVDDIATTGATLNYCSKALLDAGADEVWVCVVAKQPS